MFANIKAKAIKYWKYCSEGVWSDTRPLLRVNIVKTVNLAVKSFLNAGAQVQACALTFRTLLAIVPALALLFAIGRGFGVQDVLEKELFSIFPAQHDGIMHALRFVDSYLNRSSEGLFIGIGVAFLIWTLISLINNIEITFNNIWGVKQGRSIWRKITDYTAILLILPVLMICGGGLTLFLSNSMQHILEIKFLSPLLMIAFKLASWIFTCLFFTGLFILIPNTKVKFRPALIAGILTGISFMVLQWLFVSGQMYVAKYNAIYGSFSFLPLFLIWMQFVWVICIAGSLICYASQNIFQYTFSSQINDISPDYNEKVTIAIAALVVQNFIQSRPPLSKDDIIRNYGIPSKLVTNITDMLCETGVFSRVIVSDRHETTGFQPAVAPDKLTLNFLRVKINQRGCSGFIPGFDTNFGGVVTTINRINKQLTEESGDILLADLDINTNSLNTAKQNLT